MQTQVEPLAGIPCEVVYFSPCAIWLPKIEFADPHLRVAVTR